MTRSQLILKLNELRSLPGETEVVEFKEANNDYDFRKLGKYFSALCNEANLKGKPEAWLVFGIENEKRSIVGSKYRAGNRPHLESLKGEIGNKTSNRITFIEIHELDLPEGRVVMFQIPAAPQGLPIAWEGHYYGRDGEVLSPLNLSEIEQIRKQATHFDWSAGICEDATINDLEPEAILYARENFKIKNPRLAKEVDKWNDSVFLNKAKITIGDKITNTTMLLLGRNESAFHLLPSFAQITWILKDKENKELDYEHFSIPLLLNTDLVLKKIRNLIYRYLPAGTLFPTEVTQYEPYVIREALHNAIANQNYELQQRINLVEFPEQLIFANGGSFIPLTIENVIEHDLPQPLYRNKFLCDAMVALNMIDTIGSGIKKMFEYQRNRFFPMPDYDLLQPETVKVKIYGKIIDKNYTQLLINKSDISLKTVILLDKVQKGKTISDEESGSLKTARLIEGRKPNYYVSSQIAAVTGEKASYIKNRGLKDQHYKELILKFLDQYKTATKTDIDRLILDILPAILDKPQRENKVKNILYSMSKRDQTIVNQGTNRKPIWKKNI